MYQNAAEKLKKEGRCRMCRRPSSVRQLTRHHIVPQRRRFRVAARINDPANIVPLCRPCHCSVEYDLGARSMLRRLLTEAEVAYVLRTIDANWLNRNYPYWLREPVPEWNRRRSRNRGRGVARVR